MANQPLHPNLARIAAEYDEVHRRFALGMLDAASAQAEILSLQARDDEGVIWRIDPRSGAWLRRDREGRWVTGTPPTSGLATPTPHDLTAGNGSFNPDSRISFEHVPDVAYGLVGSTRKPQPAPYVARDLSARAKRIALIGAVATALVLAVRIVGLDALPFELPFGDASGEQVVDGPDSSQPEAP
jgi:hypothetical protein